MRASIKFYLKQPKSESTVVYAVAHYMGRRYRIFTGEKVISEYWVQEAQKSKYSKHNPDADITNQRLEVWVDTIEKAFTKFSSSLYPPDPDQLKAEVQRIRLEGSEKSDLFTAWVRSFIPRSGRSISTRTRYGTTLGFLERYQKENQPIRFNTIDMKFYRSFQP